MANGRKVVGAIRFMVNVKGLQLKCVRVLYEAMLMPVLLDSIKTVIWRGKERSRIRAVEMDNLRSLLGIKRMDRIINEWIREL